MKKLLTALVLLAAVGVAAAQSNVVANYARIILGGSCTIRTGSGSPESAVIGNVCDVYLRTNGGSATTLYVKESGTGNTGWSAAGAGGSGAPTGAQYVTLATDGTLTSERVLTCGTGLTCTDGGAGSTITVGMPTATDDTVLTGNGTTWQAKSVPDCDNATTSKLLYDQSTNAWSCGTDQTGGGGSGNITSTGAAGSEPGSPASGDIYLPNNGFYLERYSGSAWIPWGPLYPFTAPNNGSFAWVNQGGASVTTTNGGIFLLAPTNASTGWRIRKKSAPSTPYTITIAFIPQMLPVSFHRMGLLFRQSSDGKFVAIEWSYDSVSGQIKLVVNKYTNETTFSAEYTHIGAYPNSGGPVFLRITDNGTNRISSYSTDGVNFLQIHTVGRTDFLTADEVGFGADPNNATWTVGMTVLSWLEQ